MYPIQASSVYIHERALIDARCRARVERILSGVTCSCEPQVVGDAGLDAICAERGWSALTGVRTGEIRRTEEVTLILNTFRWLDAEELARVHAEFPHLRHFYLSGDGAWTFRDGQATLATHSGVCTNAYELHCAWGCLHRCDYCNVLDFLNIMVNLEELVERFDSLLAQNPWLKLWKFDNHTDTITFEPEYGASKLMVELFARQADQYLMMYTKSDNVDHLLGLDHRGRTIICWSMAPYLQSRFIEKGAATKRGRIDAMQAAQRAGYTVRARFSPIIPVLDWQVEVDAMLTDLLTRTEPDVLTLDTLKWTPPERVWGMFDKELWDDEYAGYVDQYAAMEPSQRPYPVLPNGKQLFPHEARVRLYRFFIERIRELSPHTRIAFCGETPQIWEEFREEVGMVPGEYVCACGPTSVPGNPLFQASSP